MKNVVISAVCVLFCAVLQAAPLGLVIVGDTGTGEAGQFQVSKGIELFCKENACDAGLLLGDNFYPTGVKTICDIDWQKKFEVPYQNLPPHLKFYAVLGNHDYLLTGNPEAQIYYKSPRWSMPGRYYELFLSPDVQILGIDTQDLGKDQLLWAEERLKASRAPWKIIMGHYPIYSGGEHGDTILTKSKLLPLITRYSVDFYLAGHDHNLEWIKMHGAYNYLISGAGAKLRKVKPRKETLFAKSVLGFVHMVIDGAKARVRIVGSNGAVMFDHMVNPIIKP